MGLQAVSAAEQEKVPSEKPIEEDPIIEDVAYKWMKKHRPHVLRLE